MSLVNKVQKTRDYIPEIQPANELIVSLFFDVATQWRYAGMSGTRTGLDYTAVSARISINPDYASLPHHLKNQVWDGLKTMEVAALSQWNIEAKS